MNRLSATFALVTLAALAGCGASETEIEPAPVAQLQGPWLMVNRAMGCEASYALITPNAILKLYANGVRKKYADIKKFTLEPGKVRLSTTGLVGNDPERVIDILFHLGDRQLRVEDLFSATGGSYKNPAKEISPETRAQFKTIYRLTEQRFAMDKCVGA